jgi:predicted RNA-binding protein YlxR (DUF448 family)
LIDDGQRSEKPNAQILRFFSFDDEVVIGVKNQAEPPNPQCPDSSRSWFLSRAATAE